MTLHTYDSIQQGSEEWHALRRGILTASTVGKLITVGTPDALAVPCLTCDAETASPCVSLASKTTPKPIKTYHPARTEAAAELPPVYTLDNGDTAQGLTLTLIAERIAGWTDPTFTSIDMERGIACEPIARDIYSGHYQQAVEVGFIRRDEDGWTLGYSPDGMVADDGLVEIKSPRTKTHVKWTLADVVPPQHVAQLQAGLLVTGRKWIDFVSYVGGLPLFVKRMYPDPAWFAVIEAAARRFETTATEMVAAYQQATRDKPATERLDNDLGLVF